MLRNPLSVPAFAHPQLTMDVNTPTTVPVNTLNTVPVNTPNTVPVNTAQHCPCEHTHHCPCEHTQHCPCGTDDVSGAGCRHAAQRGTSSYCLRTVFFVVRLCLFNYCREKYRTWLRYFSLCAVQTHEPRDVMAFCRKVGFCSTVEKLSYYMKLKFHDQVYKIPPLHPSWSKL
jgi:hypothetical protein